MIKFSWYTIVHPDWHKGEPPLFRLVGPAILPDEHTCDIYYKPNRKGGHRHNHIYNKCNKHLFRGRSRRKIDRKDKPEFVKTFHLNIELGNVTMDSLIHTIFHHNKKNNT